MGQRADEVGQGSAASGDEAEEIRAEIEETRAELSGTIDAIQEKLSPDNLKDQARGRAQEAAVQAKDRLQEAAVAKAQQARDVAMEKVRATRPVVEQKAQRARSTAEQKLRGSGTRTVESIKRNPKPFVLAGMGLVALVGLALGVRSITRRRTDSPPPGRVRVGHGREIHRPVVECDGPRRAALFGTLSVAHRSRAR